MISGHLPGKHFQAVPKLAVNTQGRRWFESAMHQAMFATRILALAVFVPISVVHQAVEGFVVFICDEVAGPLPAFHIPGGVTPSRARQFSFAGQELKVDGRGHHLVLGKQRLCFLELGPNIVPCHENFRSTGRIGGMHGLITIRWRNHEAINTNASKECVEFVDFGNVRLAVDGCVGAHHETPFLGKLDALNGGLEHALLFHHQIMGLFKTIEVNIEKETAGRAEFIKLALKENAISAQVDVLLAVEDTLHQFSNFRIDERFTAANADNRGSSLVNTVQALLKRQLVPDGRGIFANAATAGAGQVAGVKGLKHENQREALLTGDFLAGDIASHLGGERKGKAHFRTSGLKKLLGFCRFRRHRRGPPSPRP